LDVIAIVQARMGSTRLPGKVLKKINNRFVLDYVIERLRLCEKLDNIVLATTTAKKDGILEKLSGSPDYGLTHNMGKKGRNMGGE